MYQLPMPNCASHNQNALTLAERVAAAVDGYKGAAVLGVRGAEAYDLVNDITLVRADVLLEVGTKQRQMCAQWVGSDTPIDALDQDFLTMRRRFKYFITRELAKARKTKAA